MSSPPRGSAPCPCTSGQRYGDCCAPLHKGAREAQDAPALMRSRYCAFAIGEVDYLWRTLHPDHPDRARPEAEVKRELRATCARLKFPALSVLDHRPPDADGLAQVLFLARVFEKGKERSFLERSDFRHDGQGWRYLGGTPRDLSEVKGDPLRLTLATYPG
jgi:SEC-C motif-containing protein